jgi:branched-chain amino acid transport system ATP-binding protein/branched-chain amino acid transport system permease protein
MPALLEARDVRKQYGGVTALAGVSIEVAEGEILGVLGPNGSGKTTLFNVISGFTPPTGGSVTFLGQPIGGKRPRAIVRAGLTRSFQEAMCFRSFTVRESLALVPKARRDAANPIDPDAALRICGLEQVADTPSGDLPYGTQRKLGVALALSTGPRLLLLDEPGAGLGDDETEDLAAVIGSLPSYGISVMCIDHNLPFLLPIAHRIVVLDAGVQIYDGSPADVAKSEAVVTAYLGSNHE